MPIPSGRTIESPESDPDWARDSNLPALRLTVQYNGGGAAAKRVEQTVMEASGDCVEGMLRVCEREAQTAEHPGLVRGGIRKLV